MMEADSNYKIIDKVVFLGARALQMILHLFGEETPYFHFPIVMQCMSQPRQHKSLKCYKTSYSDFRISGGVEEMSTSVSLCFESNFFAWTLTTFF